MAQNPRDDGTARAIDAAAVMKMVRDADAAGFARRSDADPVPDRNFRKRDPLALAQRVTAIADAVPGPDDTVGAGTAGGGATTGATTGTTAGTTAGADRADRPAPPDPAPAPRDATALQTRYDEGHAEGFEQGYAAGAEEGRISGWTAGHDTGRHEAEADLQAARDTFLHAAAALRRDDVIDLGPLVPALTDAIRQLAAQRAGQAIDDMPAPFLARIEALANQARQGLETVSIRLNPDDHAAIAPHLPAAALVSKSHIVPDPLLGRGDVVLRAGGIRLQDVLAPARTPERDT